MSNAWDSTIRSYLQGEWREGDDSGRFAMINPATEEVIAHGSTAGLDMSGVLTYAREVGGANLRAMTFAERGAMLSKLAKALHEHRERFIDVASANGGNTRKDAKFDVDGATGTLQFYGALGKQIGDKKFLSDGDGIQLGRSGRWWGQHIQVPRHGAAIHINAFNFPAWGTFEKAAVAWLAGVPVVTKPASSTALLAYEMVKVAVADGLLPDGALQFIGGGVGDLLTHVGYQDVLAFTGSASTGAFLRGQAPVIAQSVSVNVEADSLNSAVLGADVESGGETWHLFLNDVARDMTQKAGQKCTAIRRILVPAERMDEVQEALIEKLQDVTVGNPTADGVGMGPVTNKRQFDDVLSGIKTLEESGARVVFGTGAEVERVGVDAGKGYFVSPMLLRADDAINATAVHAHEVFGPVSTMLPYDGSAGEAAKVVNLGNGGLVSSVYSDDKSFVEDYVLGVAPYHGRVYIGDERCAAQAMGPGVVLPMLVHGGPGRAGCGEELGGERGLGFYMQRVALQGSRKVVERTFGER